MRPDKFTSLIGIAKKAGKLVSGEHQVLQAIKSGDSHLVIVACDASENTKKLYNNKTSFYEVRLIQRLTRVQLGHAVGCDLRSAVSINDEGLANNIFKISESIKDNTYIN